MAAQQAGGAAKPLREQVGGCCGGPSLHCCFRPALPASCTLNHLPLLADHSMRGTAGPASFTAHPTPTPSPSPPQAFAAPDRVAELVGRVREALATALPEAVGAMRLYLPNPATHAILFKPIKSNVAEAHGQVSTNG